MEKGHSPLFQTRLHPMGRQASEQHAMPGTLQARTDNLHANRRPHHSHRGWRKCNRSRQPSEPMPVLP